MLSKKFYPLMLIAAVFDSQADIIKFDALSPFSNGTPIPDGYGSNSDVTVSYASLNLDGSVAFSDALAWNSGYADLNAAAFSHSNGLLLSITLTGANPGQLVTLNSFDVGAFPTGNFTRLASDLRVVDGSDFTNILVNYGPFAVPGDVAHTFTPNITAHSLNIILGTDFNNGINNIDFNVSAVPLPGAAWLFATALAGLGVITKKRKIS
ncbi:MAG: VPLPA-CTERM sorting domain-containing protein [Gammaproteobacteria bacterium]